MFKQMPVDEIKKRMFKDNEHRLIEVLRGKAGIIHIDRTLMPDWSESDILYTLKGAILSNFPGIQFEFSLIGDEYEIHILN